MKLLNVLKKDIRYKDTMIHKTIYLYTDYKKYKNTVSIIISGIELDYEFYELEGIYKDCKITNNELQNNIQFISEECYSRHIELKICLANLCSLPF